MSILVGFFPQRTITCLVLALFSLHWMHFMTQPHPFIWAWDWHHTLGLELLLREMEPLISSTKVGVRTTSTSSSRSFFTCLFNIPKFDWCVPFLKDILQPFTLHSPRPVLVKHWYHTLTFLRTTVELPYFVTKAVNASKQNSVLRLQKACSLFSGTIGFSLCRVKLPSAVKQPLIHVGKTRCGDELQGFVQQFQSTRVRCMSYINISASEKFPCNEIRASLTAEQTNSRWRAQSHFRLLMQPLREIRHKQNDTVTVFYCLFDKWNVSLLLTW